MSPRFQSTLPSGTAFFFARWREIVSAEPIPWWAHGHGIGLRLRFDELTSVAMAGQEGALDVRALKVLKNEAKERLSRSRGFLKLRYEDLSSQLMGALSGDGGLPPGGRAFGTVTAAGRLLDDAAYRDAICDEIGLLEKTLPNFRTLLELEELLELLDAELLYLGHSAAWRRRALDATEEAAMAGTPLGEALKRALVSADVTTEMHVVLKLASVVEPPNPTMRFRRLTPDDAVAAVQVWEADVGDDLLDFPEGVVIIKVESAADPEAAVARALDEFEVRRSILRLQDGDATLDEQILVGDGRRAHLLRRPAPINLLPDRITVFQEYLVREARQGSPEASILADAFVQLVQARSGLAGPAIADLWSVAEPLFSGVAGESGSGASEVMAGLGESLWVSELLDWLGKQYAELRVVATTPSIGQSHADWALEMIATRTNDVLAAIDGDLAPLVLMRTRLVIGWSKARNLHDDLARIHERFVAVGARAYLVRNLVVHRGQPQRARALSATLRPFAGLLRACLDHLAREYDEHKTLVPVTEAQVANLRVRLVADDYAAKRVQGPNPLRSAVKLGS